jgi:predicted transcriptional regulator of viral defense system
MPKRVDMEQFIADRNIKGKVFDTQTIMQFLDAPHQNTIQNVGYREKKWKIIRLKKNLYYISESKAPNMDYIANQLLKPSYVSLDTVLSRHSIIPDVVYTIFSVSTRNKASYKNTLWNFVYKTLKKSMMFGFEMENWALVADKEKALIDYLYLDMERISLSRENYKSIDQKKLEEPDLINAYKYFQAERFSNLDMLNFKKLEEYSKLSGKKKLLYIIKLLDYYRKSPHYEDFL